MTIPVAFTVAIEALLLVQVPPLTVEDKAEVKPEQKVVVPETVPAVGVALTVTVVVANADPQDVVTE